MTWALRIGWIGAGLLILSGWRPPAPFECGVGGVLRQTPTDLIATAECYSYERFVMVLVLLMLLAALALILAGAWATAVRFRRFVAIPLAILAIAGFTWLIEHPNVAGNADLSTAAIMAGFWLAAWMIVEEVVMANADRRIARWRKLLPPLLFGGTLLLLWEWLVVGFGISPIILLPPSAIGQAVVAQANTLATDFVWTFLHEVLLGWLIGCGSGFLVALVADRIPFLRRALLPLGNVVSALPIVGIAPIMIWWFTYDWPSKTAVVVAMTFFPMLVNTVAGLAASGSLERDLMRSYGASYWSTLVSLRLPAAMPFIFNGLKINSTLAMIGAIVAEYFDGPTIGMGFRINTQAALSQTDIVWAEIAVAMVAGSLFYGLIAVIERAVTFWHPSYRRA